MGPGPDRGLTCLAVARHSETKQLVEIVDAGNRGALARPVAGTFATWVHDPDDLLGDVAMCGTWRHFKGGEYRFLGRAIDEAGTAHVVYLDGDGVVWLRPQAMIADYIERGTYAGPRFRKLSE